MSAKRFTATAIIGVGIGVAVTFLSYAQSAKAPRKPPLAAPKPVPTPTLPPNLPSLNIPDSPEFKLGHFSFAPPQQATGTQTVQIPLPQTDELWGAANIASRMVYVTNPLYGLHNTLVIQDIPSGQTAGSKQSSSTVLSGQIGWTNGSLSYGKPHLSEVDNDHALHPVLSPDTRYILLGIGTPSMAWAYQLHVLDTQTNKLKKIYDPKLANPFYDWSPDGKYVVFIEGGNSDGFPFLPGEPNYIGPMALVVLEWRTGKKHLIALSDEFGVDIVCSWSKDSLIYSVLEPGGVQSPQDPAAQKALVKAFEKTKTPRPNIYEYSFKTRKSRLLMKDGYRPVLSPDGQWIAFYGSEKPEQPALLDRLWQYDAKNASLCLMRSDGTDRRALNREPDFYPQVLWLPDSKHFLTLKPTQPSPQFTAEVLKWDVEKNDYERVGTVAVRDVQAIDYAFDKPRFRGLSVSPDGNHLFYAINQYKSESSQTKRYQGLEFLEGMDLKTGRSYHVGLFRFGVDWDWKPKITTLSASSSPSASQ